MGNKYSSCCYQMTSRHIDELCSLTTQSYIAPAQLSFDSFGSDCCLSAVGISKHAQTDLGESKRILESQTLLPECSEVAEEARHEERYVESYTRELGGLQKNQSQNDKIMKNKPIKKWQKGKKTRNSLNLPSEEFQMNPEEMESTGIGEDGIRDQNNCKSYHKLVKNHLLTKGLVHLFDEYRVEYHTRYYFIVALIFIKYYLKENFNEVYQQIVQQELQAQRKKIIRKEQLKDKIEKEIKLTKESQKTLKDLLQKKQNLEKKIIHLRVVIHEIEDYSVRSCSAFFSGNTEESLRILYLKDDPVMRKKYYFETALDCVNHIEAQVRKATSRKS